jgi:hypothetical protein
MLLQELHDKLIKMLAEQSEMNEDSVEFILLQIKIICHNLLFKIYSNDAISKLVEAPEIENSITELVKKVCFTTEYNVVQIFISDYNLAKVLAINFEEILAESDTIDKNYDVMVEDEQVVSVIDIVLNKSRVESFKDYSKQKEVYSL